MVTGEFPFVQAFSGMVLVFKTQNLHLRGALKEAGEIILCIVDDSIAISGQMPIRMTCTSGGSMITCVQFHTYEVEQKHTLAILEQQWVEEGDYTIGSLTFTTIKDSVSY